MREKLIELLTAPISITESALGEEATPKMQIGRIFAENLADRIIDNGATIPVRCKDCKYCVVMSEGMCCDRALPTKRMEDYYIHGSTVLARVDGDAFCSRGERRTDETKTESTVTVEDECNDEDWGA